MAAHEEPYLPGAWENFNDGAVKEQKRVFGFYKFLNVAALLLICAFIFLYVDTAVKTPLPEVAKNKSVKPVLPVNPDQKAPVEEAIVLQELTRNQPSESPAAAAYQRRIYTLDSARNNAIQTELLDSAGALREQYAYRAVNPADQVLNSASLGAVSQVKPVVDPVLTANTQAGLNNMLSARLKVPAPIITPVIPESKPQQRVLAFQEFLEKEQLTQVVKNDQKTTLTQQNKWEVGLMVAPSIGNNNKLNMGYGVSMGYALSQKVSLVSGISYNDMSASTQLTPQANTASLLMKNSRSLESVDANVSGIDIPLGIKYNLSKKVYANLGVSAFAVLNEHKDNTYLQETPMQETSTDPSSFGEMRIVVFNERVTEEDPEATVGSKYIGFYNLSFGFRQPLSKKNTLSLEPFIKLPMKETAADNLRLIGTGIKLKLDF